MKAPGLDNCHRSGSGLGRLSLLRPQEALYCCHVTPHGTRLVKVTATYRREAMALERDKGLKQ